jgi:FkbM family methyltransferase
MTIRHILSNGLNRSLLGMSRTLDLRSLPCYFNSRWIGLEPESWKSLRQAYEPYVAKAIGENLDRGEVFFDVGSHVGLWSAFAAHIVGKQGRVYAFEPSSSVYERLERNAGVNPPMIPMNCGVGSRDEESTFFGQGIARSGSFVENVTKINEHYLPAVPIAPKKVTIRALDSLVRELAVRPKLIKVDVEGFELEVLRGGGELIRTASPSWIIEVHPPQLELSGGSEHALKDFLISRGYSIETIDRNPNSIYTVLARPATRTS